ncbi:unnamed protein product [Parascedosporium putredinis]|uniref:TauD/TfdA-like domain-containing protein n=1 Tax=Parascedosporium putredinis TaxID=1442378 RepID=A0A9P1HCF6_9PEZI|nr:unnamed protein product [Parascedosporium putredinis]CAI8004320.1 unnamed protein product [Parascedosporium putredinis]
MTTTITQSEVVIRTQPLRRQHPEPLKPSGALDQFNHVEVTPVIGREYPHVNVVDDLLNAGNSDELLRDLAITNYTSLRLTELPVTGGDTLWASGYELYDRFSDPYRRFLEGLTATYKGEGFKRAASANPERFQIYEKPRGNPANIGGGLTAVHPVVRTNPVTGWKDLLDVLRKRIEENHDLQVRFKWTSKNDLAIWDNRSAFHSATNDFDHLGERVGHRTVGIGEKPYYDAQSVSRSEALGLN